MANPTLTAVAPFTGLAFPCAAGRGVAVADRDGMGVATVLVRNGQHAVLRQRVRERFGIELPPGPRRSACGAVAFAATGPGAWLATREENDNSFARALKEVVGDAAAVADQSSGYAILRLTGPRLRDTLGKMMPLDLDERTFQTDSVASTIALHVGATLWRLADSVDGSPVFEIAMFRSLAASFWHGLVASAAEFGVSK
jgi:heterotetrameric sarcosine oxidase gamma subunit